MLQVLLNYANIMKPNPLLCIKYIFHNLPIFNHNEKCDVNQLRIANVVVIFVSIIISIHPYVQYLI